MQLIEKSDFIASYDYGMGCLWFVIRARSSLEIETKFPFLKAFAQPPKWMNDQFVQSVKGNFYIDIDEPPTGLLADLVKGKE